MAAAARGWAGGGRRRGYLFCGGGYDGGGGDRLATQEPSGRAACQRCQPPHRPLLLCWLLLPCAALGWRHGGDSRHAAMPRAARARSLFTLLALASLATKRFDEYICYVTLVAHRRNEDAAPT